MSIGFFFASNKQLKKEHFPSARARTIIYRGAGLTRHRDSDDRNYKMLLKRHKTHRLLLTPKCPLRYHLCVWADTFSFSAAGSILILFCPNIYHSLIIVCLLFCYLYQARNFLEVGTNFISTKLSSF